MLRTARGRASIAALPLDRLLTGTDGPFTQTKGRATLPTDVAVAVEALGLVRNTPSRAIAAAVCVNLRTLLDSAGALD